MFSQVWKTSNNGDPTTSLPPLNMYGPSENGSLQQSNASNAALDGQLTPNDFKWAVVSLLAKKMKCHALGRIFLALRKRAIKKLAQSVSYT